MFQNIKIVLPAEYIRVLGASLGGSNAVKEFLDALPKGLPVGFVYAQYIDARFQKVLIQNLGRHSGITMVHRVRYIIFSGMGNDGDEAAVKIVKTVQTVQCQTSQSLLGMFLTQAARDN
jgi:chemotaxis response regulator CheB